jgi:hypothetical protein
LNRSGNNMVRQRWYCDSNERGAGIKVRLGDLP